MTFDFGQSRYRHTNSRSASLRLGADLDRDRRLEPDLDRDRRLEADLDLERDFEADRRLDLSFFAGPGFFLQGRFPDALLGPETRTPRRLHLRLDFDLPPARVASTFARERLLDDTGIVVWVFLCVTKKNNSTTSFIEVASHKEKVCTGPILYLHIAHTRYTLATGNTWRRNYNETVDPVVRKWVALLLCRYNTHPTNTSSRRRNNNLSVSFQMDT